jgi:hypothetical protein
MSRDPEKYHQHRLDVLQKLIQEGKENEYDGFHGSPKEEIRVCLMHIDRIQKMKNRGVKF